MRGRGGRSVTLPAARGGGDRTGRGDPHADGAGVKTCPFTDGAGVKTWP